jgi:RNA polymerase sigma-70 factor, ECF subfamily
MTDQELIRGIIRRDNTVFREVVNLYEQHVIRTCYSLVHDDQDARDLAQEVFIEILDSAGLFRGDAKLSSWIYRIAVNKSLNHLKLQKRRQFLTRIGLRSAGSEEDHTDVNTVNGQLNADAAMIEKETRTILHHAIGKLSVNQRIAFTMNKYEELSYQEIAEVMNVSLSSVESLIHRAKMNLQKNLEFFYRDNK